MGDRHRSSTAPLFAVQSTRLEYGSIGRAIKKFRTGKVKELVVVDGYITPCRLKELAKASSLEDRLLEPDTTTIRSDTLASQPLDFLKVRFISIGRYLGGQTPGRKVRDQVAGNLAQEQKQAAEDVMCTRAIKFYGQACFTVEHEAVFIETTASCSARLSNNRIWAGLLLNDAGGRQKDHPSWTTDDSCFNRAEFLPPTTRDFSLQSKPYDRYSTSGQVLPTRPTPLDLSRVRKNSPLEFAADLLTQSAQTWSQFIAFLRKSMLRQMSVENGLQSLPANTNSANKEHLTETLRLLHQARTHLIDAVDYFDEILLFWGTVVEGQQSRADLSSVLADYKDLRKKALDVADMCKEKIATINNYMSLQTSHQALEDGYLLKRLTYLGIIYAAASLSSSVFGMNVTGLGGSVHWYYFLVVAGLLILSVLLFEYTYSWCRRMLARRIKIADTA